MSITKDIDHDHLCGELSYINCFRLLSLNANKSLAFNMKCLIHSNNGKGNPTHLNTSNVRFAGGGGGEGVIFRAGRRNCRQVAVERNLLRENEMKRRIDSCLVNQPLIITFPLKTVHRTPHIKYRARTHLPLLVDISIRRASKFCPSALRWQRWNAVLTNYLSLLYLRNRRYHCWDLFVWIRLAPVLAWQAVVYWELEIWRPKLRGAD